MIFYYIIIIMVLVSQLTRKSFFQTKIYSRYLLFIMFVFMATAVLLNPFTTDMERYLRVFSQISRMSWLEALSGIRWEPGFMTYQWILSRITASSTVFIILSTVLMWGILLFAFKKIIPYKDIPLVMLGYISFFYYYNLSSNVVRQGFAVPLLFVTLIYLEKNNYKNALFFLCLSISFHISAIIGFLLFVIKKLNLPFKTIIIIFAASVFLMITGLNQRLMSAVVSIIGGSIEESITRYSSTDIISGYGSVNRIDFLVFTIFWVILGIWFKAKYLYADMFYDWLIKSYTSLSTIYILFGFIGYSDRIAAYAWFLIPIILFYPVITMKSKYRLLWLALSMAITIGMFILFDVNHYYKWFKILQ